MSRPYQFNNDTVRSPLDRTASPFSAGQPPSFKTNVNRAKTKKWVEAKGYSYDGDEWGEYDEFDEYGADEPPPAPRPTGLRQQGQTTIDTGRNFTDPHAAGSRPLGRKNSFETGDEKRAFSATLTHPPTNLFGDSAVGPSQQQQQSYSQPPYAVSAQTAAAPGPQYIHPPSVAGSDFSDTPQHRRDFSPTAMPPPLHTRVSPAPGGNTGSPASGKFPVRKSSLSQMSAAEDSPSGSSAPVNPMSPGPKERRASNPGKGLPFIRPADIYRRVEEERQKERASLDSSRPSLDSLASRPGDEIPSPRALRERGSAERLGDVNEPGRSLQPLETVAERKSEYLPDFNLGNPSLQSAKTEDRSSAAQKPEPSVTASHTPTLALPEVRRMSTFGDDLWSKDSQPEVTAQQTAQQTPTLSPPDDPGFRSVVDQAFNRTDEDRSVPPTPISKQSDSGMSRSNTDSTSGISPIMSRVPSSATAALKNRNTEGNMYSTPAIAEETSEANTPVSRPSSQPTSNLLGGMHQIPRKPSPSHSRNVSSSSISAAGARTGLSTPSPGESPARSPAIEPQKHVPRPESAVFSAANVASPSGMEGGLDGPSASYALREADIASDMRKSPSTAIPNLGAAEKESQAAFLDTHKAKESPVFEAQPRSRSQSPSKGRVQELAGKFGEVSHSRRGSEQSIASKSSVQSWERGSQEDLTKSGSSSPRKFGKDVAEASPMKEPLDRPAADRGFSFRPKLPGQWESYATTVPTPSDQGNGMQLSRPQEPSPERRLVGTPLEEVDINPTTAKQSLASPPSSSDPLAAVRAAGSAIGEALQASMGSGGTPSASQRDARLEDRPTSRGFAVGDVYLRPLQLDRTASSIASSSAPPSPPPKDQEVDAQTPTSEDLPPPPPLKERSPEPTGSTSQEHTPTRPAMLPHLSTDPSEHDQESDRLRKEIVASLSPLRASETAETEPTRLSLQPVTSADNRESSILPSEYESYWADPDRPTSSASISNRNSTVPVSASVVGASTERQATAQEASQSTRPALMQRFSWEQSSVEHTPQLSSITKGGALSEMPDTTAPNEKRDERSTVRAVASEPAHDEDDGKPERIVGPIDTSVYQPKPIVTSGLSAQRSPTSPTINLDPVATLPTHNYPHVEGLHVVNSENPEDIVYPARLSAENTPSPQQASIPEEETKAITSPIGPSEPHPSEKAPTSEKPLGFREIVALTSSRERITTYNQTREFWANTNHGLDEWLAATVAAKPEYANQPLPLPRPAPTTRHKHTGSISLFGKHSSSATPAPSTPYFEQYNSAASQVPVTPTSGQPHNLQHRPSASVSGGRSASHQMQNKGKDLLHSAGVLGGKATTGAKGLFAKGKSRFRSSGSGDKAAHTQSVSSREASEEPEFVTTPRASVDQESPREEKRKRRLSSPFHRSSRSGSRPSSIVLPKNQFFNFGTASTHSKDTPQRETPPAECSRPQSFYAPESWNVGPDHSQSQSQLTPPAPAGGPPDRLGILPSPAKSAFSLVQQDKDGDIPPVPPIPNEHGNQANRVLQSIIRHSTPPVMGTSKYSKPDEKERETAGESEAFTKQLSAAIEVNHPNEALGHHLEAAPALESGKAAPVSQPVEEDDDRPPELHHDPVPNAIPLHLRQQPGVSPTLTPGDVSPAVSSVDQDRLDDKPPQLEINFTPTSTQFLSYFGRTETGNVSPVLAPARKDAEGERTPEVVLDDVKPPPKTSKVRPTYETERIGDGDVSPISSQSEHFSPDDATPTQAAMQIANGQSHKRGANVPLVTADIATIPSEEFSKVSQEEHAEPGAQEHLPLARPTVGQQSPSSYRIVHAVQHMPSHSSLESFDYDSTTAPPSQTDGSQQGDTKVNKSLPPVPQIPGALVESSSRQKGSDQQTQPGHEIAQKNEQFEYRQQDAQLSPPQLSPMSQGQEAPNAHRRSRSLISAISAVVSAEGPSVSPTTDRSGRSRPASSDRRSPAVSAITPVDRPQNLTPQLHRTSRVIEPTQDLSHIHDDGYDLYADHNGVVKDVRDERTGEPLKINTDTGGPALTEQVQRPMVNEPPKSEENVLEEETRYSTERPMSFVSVPRDANGMPQEQLSRGDPEPIDTSSNVRPPSQTTVKPVEEIVAGKGIETGSGSRIKRQSQIRRQSGLRSASQSSQLQTQNFAQGQDYQSHIPRAEEPKPQDPQVPAQFGVMGSKEPRLRDRQRAQLPQLRPQDTRHTRLPDGSSPPPRNEHEAQQQYLVRQAMDPRLLAAEYKLPGVGPPKGAEDSSRPKLSSVFKNIGGRKSLSPAQSSSNANNRINPNLMSPEEHRAFSYQSSVGDLPTEQVASKKKEKKPGIFGSLNGRPQSVGQQSVGQASHVSAESTRAHPAESRQDLRLPVSPPPFKGIPPQQQPPGVLKQPPPKSAGAVSTPDSGKKKRFSALGSLFGRSGSSPSSKPPKLSKEDKKALKHQKLPLIPQQAPAQPPIQRYGAPPQQYGVPPQQFRPQGPYGGPMQQYVPPPGVAQGFIQQPGYQMLPRTAQQWMSPQSPPQQYPPQQFPGREGSAYAATRQMTQNYAQPPQAQVQSPISIGSPHAMRPGPLISNMVNGNGSTPPPQGYFAPTGAFSHEKGARGVAATNEQEAVQSQSQPTNQRRVSSPASMHSANPISPASQRRVSSTLSEPRYERQEIPAPYHNGPAGYIPGSQPSSLPGHQALGSHHDAQSQHFSEAHRPNVPHQISSQSDIASPSTPHVVSPISANSSPSMLPLQFPNNQMGSITRAVYQERSRNESIPEEVDEAELSRMRHQQYMQQVQQQQMQQRYPAPQGQPQLGDPRNGHTPSPHPPPSEHSARANGRQSPHVKQAPSEQTGALQGFREVLPRSSPQPYPMSQTPPQHQPPTSLPSQQEQPLPRPRSPQRAQPTPLHPNQIQTNGERIQPASYPLPMSPASVGMSSPANPLAASMPPPSPPKISSSPMPPPPQPQTEEQAQDYHPPGYGQEYQESPPPPQGPVYEEEHAPDDLPPSYEGPGLANEGMDKLEQLPNPASNAPRLSPLPYNVNQMSEAELRGRAAEPRSRQASIGILQHPQPASMAASPQRSAQDMGAEILRRQMLEQEERDRVERIRKGEQQRIENERERQERARARARAAELERSVSGGGRVGSLMNQSSSVRSTQSTGRIGGGGSSWERRGSIQRPVFELPAEEDDEPVMRGASYPGQEWMPMWEGD